MDGELSLDNILGADELENLFSDEQETQETDTATPEERKGSETVENTEDKEIKETTEVDAETLFSDEPEGVGSAENIEEKEDTSSTKDGTSPDKFYSSIAKALEEEGIFPDLSNEEIEKIVTPEDFRDLIEQRIQSELGERQKRIDEALKAGIEPTAIQRYENVISYLDTINEDNISDESEKGEKLRRDLIYQDYINRRMSPERAKREVDKSFNAGSDIDDAKEALKSNKEFFKEEYNSLIEDSKKEEERIIKERNSRAEKLHKEILENKKVFGDIEVDKSTRQKVYDNISKASYKDPETGQYYTPLQKYQKENSDEFIKNVGLLYTLTDGFKNIDKLVNGRVKKEVKRGLRELEHTLNNTARNPDGSLRLMSGVNSDSDSFIGMGITLDV